MKTRVYLTPLTYFLGFFFYQSVLVPILSWAVLAQLSVYHALMAGIYSLVFAACVLIGWTISKRILQSTFNNMMNFLSIKNTGRRFSEQRLIRMAIAYFMLFVFSFLVLAYLSGAGTLWITDSRTAYQYYRNGVGVFYATSTSLLSISYVCAIYGQARQTSFLLRAIPTTLFFAIFAFFLGSKSLIIGLFIIMLVYYSYHIKPFSVFQIVFLFIALSISVSLLQLIQGTAETAQDTILYANYFYTTAEFLRRFSGSEFSLQFGNVLASNIWSYVPRILYPDKPYEYGQLLINKVIFPGAAELGHSPGLLPWAAYYLDFGILGIIFYGILSGCWLGWTHRFYANRKTGVVDFWILLKLGGFPAFFTFFPLPIFMLVILPFFSLSISVLRSRFFKIAKPFDLETTST